LTMNVPDDTDSDDVMRSLLQRSRAVPAVDARRVVQAREVVHAAWLDATAPPSRRWLWTGAAAAIAVTAAVYGLWRQPTDNANLTSRAPSSPIVAVVQHVTGAVQVRDPGNNTGHLLRAGESLRPGAAISTGASGRGTMALPDGIEVRMDRGTTLRLEADHRVALDAGAVYVDTTSRSALGAPILVSVQDAVVSDVGTRYEVRVFEDRMRVRVRDGLVRLRRGGRSHDAPAATELMMTHDDVRVTRTSVFGADWDWIVAAARAPRVDGRSLAEFLAWVQRESGRDVRFEDRALERSASRTIVYGTVEGLTVDEALDIVLPSCGLTHRIDNGAITVVAMSGGKPPR
jgi:ferric-dicitrate binding protein FerR (iron transport regulator)